MSDPDKCLRLWCCGQGHFHFKCFIYCSNFATSLEIKHPQYQYPFNQMYLLIFWSSIFYTNIWCSTILCYSFSPTYKKFCFSSVFIIITLYLRFFWSKISEFLGEMHCLLQAFLTGSSLLSKGKAQCNTPSCGTSEHPDMTYEDQKDYFC